MWCLLLAAIVAGQWFTAGVVEANYVTPDVPTESAFAEYLWFFTPISLMAIVAVSFGIGVKRWVPYAPVRPVIWALGFAANVVAGEVSVYISLIRVFTWYMD